MKNSSCGNCNECGTECGRANGIEYTSYADGNVVKADLNNTMFDAVDVVEKIFRGFNPKSFFISTFTDGGTPNFRMKYDLLMNDNYTGRAKRNIEVDKQNIEIGMEVARGRCLERYHRAFDKRIMMLLEDARTLLACVEHYCEKARIDTTKVDSVEDIKARRFSCGK